jgi:hypothetical protein
MSLGGAYSKVLEEACEYAYSKGVLLVAAAGNNRGSVLYPAALSSVIAVSSVDSSNRLSSFSSYGSKIELAAPGENILSTHLNSYTRNSGTSMAAAHVSGAAALAKQLHIDWSSEELRSFLRSATLDLGSSGKDEYYGYGLIDAGKINVSARLPSINATAPQGNVTSQTAIQTLRTYYAAIGPFPGGRVYYKVAAQDSPGNSVVDDNRGSNYAIVVDATPPTGSITINSGAAYTSSTSATLFLACSDASGCAEMQFSNDGITYSAPEGYAAIKSWTLESGDGTKTVYAKFKDGAGNWAAPVSDTIILDTAPPLTTDNAPSGWQKADFAITLIASDALSSVSHTSYRVDGGAWVNGTSIPVTAEGNHSIEYYSVDNVGNAEAVKRTYAALDKTPPVITIAGIEDGKYYNTDVIANITIFDANINVTSITLDGIQYTSGTPISAEGAHILEAFASDLAGNAAYANVSFIIDKTVPSVRIISPANGSYVRGIVEVNGSAGDANLDTASISINGSVVTNATSHTWNTAQAVDGSYEITLTATDKATNSAPANITVTVDNTPPSVSILQPTNNSYIASKEVILSWNASDNIRIASYEVFLDEVSLENTTEIARTLANLTEGLHSVEVKAFDLANNSASDFVSFTIDTIPPEINITGVANGSYYNTDVSANIRISDTNLKTILILLDGATYESGTLITSEGIHVLQVYADDKAGNNASQRITFTSDKTPPEVNITSPVNGTYVRGIIQIIGTATDINLDRASLSIDGTEVANALPYSWNTANYSDGMHVIELKAIDRVNNSASMSVSVIVDNTPPDITVTSPLAQNYPHTKNITVSFNVTDATSGVALFRAYIDGSRVANGQVIDLSNFTLGEHALTVEASDNAGNKASASVNFTVVLRAEINIDPDILNLKSESKWITAYIEFQQYDVMSIDINTVTLNRTIKAENDPKYDFVSSPQLQDKDGDGLPELMVKFDRSAVEQILQPADAVTLSVSGEFAQGIFEGYDAIRVIQKNLQSL